METSEPKHFNYISYGVNHMYQNYFEKVLNLYENKIFDIKSGYGIIV